MFLIEIYNNNVRGVNPDFRISDEFYSFEHLWHEGLTDITGMDYSIDTPHGGWISPNFGLVSFIPVIVPTDYIGIDIHFSNSDEASKVLIFRGVAYVNSRTRTLTTYDLFGDMPNTIIDETLGLNITNTNVLDIFKGYFEDVSVGWTVNFDSYTATDTDVNRANYGAGQLYSQFLSELCQTYQKYFVLDPLTETVYLRDIGTGVGSNSIDGFTYLPSRYIHNIPPAKVTVQADSGDSITDKRAYHGTFFFGRDITLKSFYPDDTPIDINQNLADKLIALYRDNPIQAEFFIPLEYFVEKNINFFTNNRITWEDDTVPVPDLKQTYTMDILNISFNVPKEEVILSGHVETS